MKQFKIGDNVKTNDFYESESVYHFGECNHIKSGTIKDIINSVAKVKLRNGRERFINVMFLESL